VCTNSGCAHKVKAVTQRQSGARRTGHLQSWIEGFIIVGLTSGELQKNGHQYIVHYITERAWLSEAAKSLRLVLTCASGIRFRNQARRARK